MTASLAGVVVALAAPPAAAEPSTGWPESEPVDILNMLLLLGGIPLLLFVGILAFVYTPPIARGESVRPGAQEPENQWLGGPRRSAGELAAPDTESSEAGGASGRW